MQPASLRPLFRRRDAGELSFAASDEKSFVFLSLSFCSEMGTIIAVHQENPGKSQQMPQCHAVPKGQKSRPSKWPPPCLRLRVHDGGGDLVEVFFLGLPRGVVFFPRKSSATRLSASCA
jgi:hypothetical protein